MLSLRLKRYFEPLRLPLRANALSFPYTHQSVVSPPPKRVSSTGQCIFLNMPSLLPRETPRATSVVPARVQRPSPFVHRVGISTSSTRLHMGSLALRPALLLLGNSRPRVTTTPLPRANKAHGQLLVRDFNPLDALLLLRTDRPRLFHDHCNVYCSSLELSACRGRPALPRDARRPSAASMSV